MSLDSRVTMVPNERFDNATAPQFMWLEGDSETYGDDAPVMVVAKFIANEGAFSCQPD